MQNLMQSDPVNLIDILKYAARWRGDSEIVSNSVEGGIHRETYQQAYQRSAQLAHALKALGTNEGDRVATMAWNTWRHVECWYAIAGIGAICHTLNPRLSTEQLHYIVEHAEDRFLFVDLTFFPIIAGNIKALSSLEGIIILTDQEHMPEATDIGIPVHCFEDLISDQPNEFDWQSFPEEQPSSLCYTSGTTGDPKGVLYSHRSNLHHAYASCSSEAFAATTKDSFLVIVPMFHANSWGLAFCLPMSGAKMVMPGPHMDGASVYSLIEQEQVTKSAAVPTVWSMLLDYLDTNKLQVPTMKETVIGGSCAPRSMIVEFAEKYDVQVLHAWGMTETSPLGTINRIEVYADSLPKDEILDYQCKQGRPPFGVDIKLVDDDGNELPRDGETSGRLMIKGPWVIERYYKKTESALENGWLDTGDIATIDAHGFMQITDRAKDVIKSGGEWISSVDLENAAVAHPGIQLAACIGVKHPKWEERPLLIIQTYDNQEIDASEINALLEKTFASWQLPDAIIRIEEIPLTATGKVDKKPLRKDYMEYLVNQES